jgi:hypothetical protein
MPPTGYVAPKKAFRVTPTQRTSFIGPARPSMHHAQVCPTHDRDTRHNRINRPHNAMFQCPARARLIHRQTLDGVRARRARMARLSSAGRGGRASWGAWLSGRAVGSSSGEGQAGAQHERARGRHDALAISSSHGGVMAAAVARTFPAPARPDDGRHLEAHRASRWYQVLYGLSTSAQSSRFLTGALKWRQALPPTVGCSRCPSHGR